MQFVVDDRQAPSAPFMEHRWGQRVTLHAPVHLVRPLGAEGAAMLRDASISGGFLETDRDLRLHANVGVVLLAGTGTARRAVEVSACVTRVAADGVGIEWRDMASPPILALLRATGAEFAYLTTRDRVFN